MDLTNVFGGAFRPPVEQPPPPPDVQLIDAIRAAGMEPPTDIQFDGRIHRFKSGTKGSPGHGDKPGWYIVFGDGVPAGKFGCWRSGVEINWRADIGRKLSQTEEMAHARRLAEAKLLRDAELKRQREAAAETVEAIWSGCMAAAQDHPYLARKGIGLHGARVTGDGRLVVPLYTPDGELSSLQYIGSDGEKRYHPGAQTGGCYWMLGTMDEPGALFVAEGFATAATITEVTRRPCVVAYSASNLVPVVGSLRDQYGSTQDIVIVADNDLSGVGERYAEQASAKYGARMVMPPEKGQDANDYKMSGGDLSALLMPPKNSWLIAADEFCKQPAPISWLIKGWLQSEALVMIHGPSGGGKTFLVLDWCLRVASHIDQWAGHRVKHGPVVYLAGEGHHGLRARVAAWKHYHHIERLDMWLSKDGCDLNTPDGYMKVVESLRQLPSTPAVIVIDTLHRFLHGDENSAQDAKSMIDACGALMREFRCTVIQVHHTGVSAEAQHRARGSSAWKGALDIEVNILPAEEPGQPIEIIQRKSKDAELAQPITARLESVEIPGWLDEDGEQVTSAVLVQCESDEKATITKESKALAEARRQFEKAINDGFGWLKGGRIVLRNSAWIEYLKGQDYPTDGARRNALYKAKKALLDAQYIEAFEDGYAPTQDAMSGVFLGAFFGAK